MQGSLNSVKLSDSQANPVQFMKQEYFRWERGGGKYHIYVTWWLPLFSFSGQILSYPLKKISACPGEPLS